MWGRRRPVAGDTVIEDGVRFTLLRQVAEGGMGTVHEAILHGPEGFEKTVAIKTIKEELTQDPEFVAMFVGEAKLVADLVHGHIVQMYQLGRVGDTWYMALEWVDGVNLYEIAKRHQERGTRIPVELSAYVASRVARALEYAHGKRDRDGHVLGVVHRDISPRNVMVSREGFVKLADFGIAKARNLMRDAEGEVLLGKARYMSPEQARMEPTDARSDLFSLGVVLHELVLAQPLFVGESTTTILEAVESRQIPRLKELDPSVPDALDAIVATALERDPARRYPDAGAMAVALEHFLYDAGLGPTIVNVQLHLAELWPERFGMAG